MEQGHYDAIIIGSGQGGGPLATAFTAAGRRTALIEREHIGGVCINEGCTPTKTMIASARVAALARRGKDYGIDTGKVSVDMEAVRARKRKIVEEFRSGSLEQIEAGGVDVLMGEASFTGTRSLFVKLRNGETRSLDSDIVVIDTGSRPSSPPIPGLDSVPALNSTTVMELSEVPEHLLIIGGGYVGVEFGQMFRRFGSRVTIIQNGSGLLAREDPEIAEAVAEVLRGDGIDLLLSTNTQNVRALADGQVGLQVETPQGQRELSGSHLLVAAGRTPNTDALDLSKTGVRVSGRGIIEVDDRLKTSAEGIYAIGEVAGTPAFTHMSYDDFRILKANLLEGESRSTRGRLVPYTVFIDPQLGRVGLTEQEAKDKGLNFAVFTMPMSHVARALEVAESLGTMKVIVDRDTKRIVGCAVLGLEGGEMMAMVEIAMMGDLPFTALRDGIFAHPTLAEAFNNLFSSEPA